MKRIAKSAVACGAVGLATAFLFTFPAGDGDASVRPAVKSFVAPLEVVPTSSSHVPMGGSERISVEVGEGPARPTEVHLRRTWYRYRVVELRDGRSTEVSSKTKCYELVSNGAYRWAHYFDPNWPAGAFALFQLDAGEAYLGWSSALLVKLVDITQPRDRILAFHEYLVRRPPPGPPEVAVPDLVPGGSEWGGPKLQSDTWVEILSLATDADERLLLTVQDAYSPAAAVLALRGGEWVLREHYPNGLPGRHGGDE